MHQIQSPGHGIRDAERIAEVPPALQDYYLMHRSLELGQNPKTFA